ncbi:helix-turn-helix transcriptional regulator [Janthinobacterium sp. HLX7-2]|uniref:helix-turn-helix transcriptional regulator n=1 Tax=Janthinobacterium sp. HLX7-2 TaxID=1259331 RepID=UPI003F2381F9
MKLLRAVVNFDSARLLSVDFASGTALIQGSIMYNIPENNVLDWENIHRNDLVLQQVMAHPNRPLSFHSPTLFAAPQHAIMRDYANRYDHQNGLVMVLHDRDTGFSDGLSFYRACDEAHFGRYEQRLIRAVMPHLQEALKLNRQLAIPSASVPAQGALLIAQIDGNIQHCEQQASGLMQTEWSDWRGARLPAALITALSAPGSTGYAGKRIVVTCSRINTLLFLRIMPRSPLTRLTQRELEVACLYGKGHPTKAIAAQLGISPVTVRNLLQNSYLKLDVHDKATLANLIGGRLS